MSDPKVPRRVTDVSGMWQVIHPFTGQVEFATSDRGLATLVAEDRGHHDPITVAWLFSAYYALPPVVRRESEWFMSTATLNTIRRLTECLVTAMPDPALPYYLIGLPIALDEHAVGVSLRERGLASSQVVPDSEEKTT